MEVETSTEKGVLFRVVNGIEKIEMTILTILFAEVIIIGFLQVICRFILNDSLSWSEELLRFSFIWLTYFAASLGLMKGSHSSVDVVLDRLPPKVHKVARVLIEVLVFVFVVVIFYNATQLIGMQVKTKQLSASMRLPMYVPYLGILIAFGFMIIQIISRLYLVIRTLIKPQSNNLPNPENV
ncbi:MAG: TRAP transporter small permease [Clostridiales bacterium]